MNTGALLGQVLVNGLVLSALYVLMALGFTLIFGVLRIVNFAHGEFYMLGAFMVYVFFARSGVSYPIAVVLAVLISGILGAFCETAIFRPFRSKDIEGMISALGLSIVLQNLALVIWGPYDLGVPQVVRGSLRIDGIILATERVLVVVMTMIILAAFYVFLKYTKTGLAIRALAQDMEITVVMGIKLNRAYTLAFALGTALAAAAGALVAPLFQINPWIGHSPMMKSFIVVILGGLGNIPGAVIGGLILGFVESVLATFVTKVFADWVGFVLVMLILLIRPAGLLGRMATSR